MNPLRDAHEQRIQRLEEELGAERERSSVLARDLCRARSRGVTLPELFIRRRPVGLFLEMVPVGIGLILVVAAIAYRWGRELVTTAWSGSLRVAGAFFDAFDAPVPDGQLGVATAMLIALGAFTLEAVVIAVLLGKEVVCQRSVIAALGALRRMRSTRPR